MSAKLKKGKFSALIDLLATQDHQRCNDRPDEEYGSNHKERTTYQSGKQSHWEKRKYPEQGQIGVCSDAGKSIEAFFWDGFQIKMVE